jgi:hypothetical protein
MREYFKNIDWSEELQNMEVNSSYERWFSLYHEGCRKYIPVVKVSSFQRINGAIWMNKEIKKLSCEKRRTWFACRKLKFSDKKLLEDYKELNKILKKKIKQRIKDFENDLALKSKTKPKQVYAYMNKKIKVKDTIRAIQSKEGSIETNGKKIADTLNGFFASVFTKSDVFESPTIIETSSCSCQDPDFNEIIVERY